MTESNKWSGKRVAVAGFGLEGRSAAAFLAAQGAAVTVFDRKAETDFPAAEIGPLRDKGVEFRLGAFGPFAGFDAIVRSPGIPPHSPQLAAAAAEGVPITSATQIFFDLCPCLIVGVTGTKGKGTTSSLIHGMLRAAGKEAYLCGNIGAPALDFLPRLTGSSIVVYELSSFQLIELDQSPGFAVMLMVTSDHLDFHRTGEEYVGSKANLLRYQGAGDVAIVNIDYPSSRAMIPLTQAKVFHVSRRERAEKGAYMEGDALMLATDAAPRKLIAADEVPLAGAHNLENVAAASLAASLLGVEDADIVRAIRDFRALPHRFELVREAGGVRYFDDSISTTPESALAAMQALREPKILILGGSSKGADWEAFARAFAADASVRAVIGLGEEWRRIKAAIDREEGTRKDIVFVEDADSMAAAVASAAALAESGDAVILSPGCASFGMFENYKDRGEQFAAAAKSLPG